MGTQQGPDPEPEASDRLITPASRHPPFVNDETQTMGRTTASMTLGSGLARFAFPQSARNGNGNQSNQIARRADQSCIPIKAPAL
jgi:hypothetical protein